MVFLTSDGLSGEKLKEAFLACAAETGKKCAVVPTAMEREKSMEEELTRVTEEIKAMGLLPEVFNIGSDEAEKLNDFDVVYLCGGNVFYLMRKINEAGDDIKRRIAKAAKEKIVMGVSAGSLVLQDDLVLIRELIPRMNKCVKLKEFTALGLTGGVECLPHRSRYMRQIEAFEKRVKTYERKSGRKVICLEDGQGVKITRDGSEIIG